MTRLLLHLSSLMAQPLCDIYRLLRYQPLIGIPLTILFIPFIPLLIPYTLILKILRAAGFALQKETYTHVQGDAPEKPLQHNLKIAFQNICAMAALSLSKGGVSEWPHRIDALLHNLLADDPDVIVLNEIYDTACAEAIIRRLKHRYAHFYIHLGKRIFGSSSGLMCITRCPVRSFENIEFQTNRWLLARSYFICDLHQIRIIGTHLSYRPEDAQKRKLQFQQILDRLKNSPFTPTLFVGDANAERDSEASQLFGDHLEHLYLGKEHTCSERFIEAWKKQDPYRWLFRSSPKTPRNRMIDYISIFKQRGVYPNNLKNCCLGIHRARVGFEDLDSARQSQIEGSTAPGLMGEHPSQIGKNDCKRINISNMDPLAIVQPRELSHGLNSKVETGRGITGRAKLIRSFNHQTALSDHHGLFAEVDLIEPRKKLNF